MVRWSKGGLRHRYLTESELWAKTASWSVGGLSLKAPSGRDDRVQRCSPRPKLLVFSFGRSKSIPEGRLLASNGHRQLRLQVQERALLELDIAARNLKSGLRVIVCWENHRCVLLLKVELVSAGVPFFRPRAHSSNLGSKTKQPIPQSPGNTSVHPLGSTVLLLDEIAAGAARIGPCIRRR